MFLPESGFYFRELLAFFFTGSGEFLLLTEPFSAKGFFPVLSLKRQYMGFNPCFSPLF